MGLQPGVQRRVKSCYSKGKDIGEEEAAGAEAGRPAMQTPGRRPGPADERSRRVRAADFWRDEPGRAAEHELEAAEAEREARGLTP